MNLFFKEFIETSLENLPVLQSTHLERKKSQEFRLTQTIQRLVYTEFDNKLSRYLSATRGEGFPAYSVKVEISGAQPKDPAKPLASVFHGSMIHALLDIAERAVDRVGPVEVALQRSLSTTGKQPPILHKRKLAPGDVEMLGTVLGICRSLGDLDYLEISGDFDAIVATPPGGLNPVILHLQNGSVQVPSEPTGGGTPFQWPVYAYADRASSNPSAQSYLASVGQAIVAEKEAAIFAFRSAAERRIVDFQRALDGRRLEGHWLKGAKGLVARLQIGLGDDLKGISEDAQGIAFELAEAIENLVENSAENVVRARVVAAPVEEPEMLLVNPVEEPEMVLSNPAPAPAPASPAVAAVPEAVMRTVVFVPDPEDWSEELAPDPEMVSPGTGPAPVTQFAEAAPEVEVTSADAVAEPEMPSVDPGSAPEALPVVIEPEPEMAMAVFDPEPGELPVDLEPEPEPEMPMAASELEPEPEMASIDSDPEPQEPPVDPDPEPEMPWAASEPELEETPVDPDPEPEVPMAASAPEPEEVSADPDLEPEEMPVDPDPEPEMPWAASHEAPSGDPDAEPEQPGVEPEPGPAPEAEIRLVACAQEPEMPVDGPDADPEASPETVPDDPDRYRRIPLLLGDLAF